jgi:hypothetical protein
VVPDIGILEVRVSNVQTDRISSSNMQVRERLCSDSWEGRTAAGDCLGLIAAHCQHNTVADVQAASKQVNGSSRPPDARVSDVKAERGQLSLQGFSIDRVLQHGTQLLASGGTVSWTSDAHHSDDCSTAHHTRDRLLV